jgi:8-oxo-dGTP pyrophosphatase MutT (NUDIX family)
LTRREPNWALGRPAGLGHSVAMSTAKNGSGRRTRVLGSAPAGHPRGFLRLSRLRQLLDCEQVAAVCYRMRGDGIEFLLVRTRGSGRWTFPKGNAEPGMTHAQAAALEAFEEAGVHGRIQEASFAQYMARKRTFDSSARPAETMLTVNAHLCEVLRLGNPREDKRNRTWFSAEDTRKQLQEGRKRVEAAAYARVVDRAVERIRKQQEIVAATACDFFERDERQKDALHEVQFEMPAHPLWRHLGRQAAAIGRSVAPPADAQPRELVACEVLQFDPSRESNRSEKWLVGKKKPKALSAGIRS